MKSFGALVPALGLIAGVQATYGHGWSNGTTVWTTVTVETLTTYCPEATTFTHGTKTYTATAHETLTITDCPCTSKIPVTHYPHPPPAVSTHVPVTTHTPVTTKVEESKPPISVTITVSEYTTFCPYPTLFPVGPNSTITVTEPTTLTVKDCPCTLTKPAVVTTTINYVTTYCPVETTVTIGTSTHTLPAGTVTIPVEHVTTVPAPEVTHPAPEYTKPAPEVTHPAPEYTKPAPCNGEAGGCPPSHTTVTIPVESVTTIPGAGPSTVTIPVEVVTPVKSYPHESVAPPAATDLSSVYVPGPTTTQASAGVPAGTGSAPSSSTSGLLEANNAGKREAGFGAIVVAGVVAAFL